MSSKHSIGGRQGFASQGRWIWGLVLCSLAAPGCQLTAQGLNAEGAQRFSMGDYNGAIDRFTRAIYEDPNNADAYYNLARTYHAMGTSMQRESELTQAESYYNQCLDHNPDHPECYRGLAVLLVEQDRSEEAFRLLQGWAQRSPTLAEPRVELARLFEEFGDRDTAKERLLEAIAIDPYDDRARAALGKLHEEEGDLAQALKNYQVSLARNRLQPQVRARIAQLQTALGPAPTPGPPVSGDTRIVTSGPAVLR